MVHAAYFMLAKRKIADVWISLLEENNYLARFTHRWTNWAIFPALLLNFPSKQDYIEEHKIILLQGFYNKNMHYSIWFLINEMFSLNDFSFDGDLNNIET